VRLKHETVWLTQAQMVKLFQRDQSVISRHVNNVFKEGGLPRKSNMQKMHIANSDKPVAFYNLNVIISVGYRVKCPARHPVSHLGNLSLKGLSGTWLYFESEASCRKRDG